jgi:outer membrane receptor protein involved in Fe transport
MSPKGRKRLFTGLDFSVNSQRVGDQLLPNTPGMKGNLAVSYVGAQGLDANLSVRLVDGYQWAAGVFQGYVPSNEFVDLSAGYRVNNNFECTPPPPICWTSSDSSSTAAPSSAGGY